MTAGANGEPEDPFGYLYRPGPGEEQADVNGGAAGTGGYGSPAGPMMPRYVQVGQMQYGQPAPYAPAEAQPTIPAQQGHHPAAPPAGPGTPPTGGRGADRRGGGGRGALIGGAVAIVLVVAVIAGVALLNGGSGKDDQAGKNGSSAPTGPSSPEPSEETRPTTKPTVPVGGEFGKIEAESTVVSGGAVPVPGEGGSGATLVKMDAPGSKLEWTVDAQKKGTYYLAVRYANGEPASGDPRPHQTLSILVNGKDIKNPIKLYGAGKWEYVIGSWANVPLDEGQNQIALTCGAADKCKVNVDQVWLDTDKPNFR